MLLVLILTGAWFWLDKNRPEVRAELREIPSTIVEMTKVVQEDVQTLSKITGRLIPARRAKLNFEVSGQVYERHVEPGQKVISGEELIRIDGGDFEDVVSEMQIHFEQEQEAIARDKKLLALVNRQVTLLQREVNRLDKLKKQSLISQSKIDETSRQLLRERSEQAQLRHSVQTAESRLKMREVAMNKAQRNLQRTVLKAPFAATVNAVEVSVGDYVSPGQAVIELVQVDELDLQADVTGKASSSLKLGQAIFVMLEGTKHEGTLISLQYDPDPVTHTHAIKVRLIGDSLFPGQLGEVLLTGQTITNALVVPITAVLREDGDNFLYRIKNDHVVRVAVSIQGRDKDNLLVSGIEAGDQIVARDVASLEDGQSVVVR